MLEVPADVSGLGVQGQRRVGVQGRALGAALGAGPRLGLGGGPIDEIRLGVVAPRDPGVGSRAPGQRQIAPGVAAGVSGACDGRGAPQLGAGLRIVGGDEADVVLVPLAPRDPGDDPSLHDDRAAGVPIAEVAVGDPMLPDELARPRVEGNQLRAARAGEDLVVVNGNAAPRHARPAVDRKALVRDARHSARMLPQEVPGGRMQRLHAAAAGHVHHAVAHERGHLVRARLRRPGPDELEAADIVPVDLVERAVALTVQRPAPVDPVAVVRGKELLGRDRLEVGDLRLRDRSQRTGQQRRDDQAVLPESASTLHGRDPIRFPRSR